MPLAAGSARPGDGSLTRTFAWQLTGALFASANSLRPPSVPFPDGASEARRLHDLPEVSQAVAGRADHPRPQAARCLDPTLRRCPRSYLGAPPFTGGDASLSGDLPSLAVDGGSVRREVPPGLAGCQPGSASSLRAEATAPSRHPSSRRPAALSGHPRSHRPAAPSRHPPSCRPAALSCHPRSRRPAALSGRPRSRRRGQEGGRRLVSP